MKTVVLISNAYPFGSVTEKAFILPEIEYLAKAFDRVILAPLTDEGLRDASEVFPKNVKVTDAMVINATAKDKIKGLCAVTPTALSDLIRNLGDLRRSVAYSAYTGMSLRNLRRLIRECDLNLRDTLFYTFWFDYTTTALTLLPGARFITRCHRYDLYEDRELFIDRKRREETLKRIICCYPVAHAGTQYMQERYPAYAEKIQYRKLGSPKPSGMNPSQDDDSNDRVIFLCIARLAPEKGTGRQLRLVEDYARKYPEKKIRYIHIGEGPLMHLLEKAQAKAPENLEIKIMGRMDNAAVHRFLQKNHIDLTLLLSESEGLPVSLMESISYGIPFIATNVGGIKEIVPEAPELVVSSSPTSTEFAEAVDRALESGASLREIVRRAWERDFSAETIRKDFAEEIRGLL